jgi:hypothetical protein
MRAKSLLLLAWLLGILFPAAWLRNFSTTYRQFFNAIFGAEWVHVVMHTILFASLCILAATILRLHPGRRTSLALIGMLLLVGLAQELLQNLSQGISRPYLLMAAQASTFDLLVDLSGGLLGLLLIYLHFKLRPVRLSSISGRS